MLYGSVHTIKLADQQMILLVDATMRGHLIGTFSFVLSFQCTAENFLLAPKFTSVERLSRSVVPSEAPRSYAPGLIVVERGDGVVRAGTAIKLASLWELRKPFAVASHGGRCVGPRRIERFLSRDAIARDADLARSSARDCSWSENGAWNVSAPPPE